MSNPLFDALQAHTKTPAAASKESLKESIELAWKYAAYKRIHIDGLGCDIILAAVMGMDITTRRRLMTDRDFNSLYATATALQGTAHQFWSEDVRHKVLEARLNEAKNNHAVYGGVF